MNWLNLQTSTLRAPEYIGSEPVARATWLNVLAYCCEQENGGRIVGGAAWKDRQWQQTCGVTLAEVQGATLLIYRDGDDLIVWNYPADKEVAVIAKREGGKRGGAVTSEAKAEAAKLNGNRGGRPKTQAETQAESGNNPSLTQGKPKLNPSLNPTEGKGMERNGMEEKGSARESLIPSLDEFGQFYFDQIPCLGDPCPVGDWLMETHGYLATNVWPERPPKNWRAMLGKLVSDYRGRHAELVARNGGGKGRCNSDL